MIGETVGSYRIVAQLGSGGMGAVWLGEHKLIGSQAAIKVLRPEYSENTGIVQRFFDEARAATRIHHPGIVTVHDFGWQDGKAFLVMEYLRGETLMSTIRQTGRLEPVRALHLAQQCALAMAAAHAAGIVHRDLKPENIHVIPDPLAGERVKILDFGIAKLLGEDPGTHNRTQTGMIMGTPAYMSPEQCRGAGSVDHRSDIYALGCVLFHMLTGRPPFIAQTPGDLIACHLTVQPPTVSSLAPGISDQLDELLARCLAKELPLRTGSMEELAEVISRIITTPSIVSPTLVRSKPISVQAPGVVASVPATTMQTSAGESLPLPTRARRGGFALALVMLAAGIAVTAVIATRDHAASPGAAPPADATQPARDAAAGPAADAAELAKPDAGTGTPPPVHHDSTTRRGSGARGTTAGSAAGSGSSSDYNPYVHR